MKPTTTPRVVTSALSLLFLSAISAQAALTLNFSLVSDNPPPGAEDVKLQATVDFYGPNGVSIVFGFDPTSSVANVHELYFEDTTTLLNGIGSVFNTTGTVLFTSPANPASLPGATFTETFGYDSSPTANGLTFGETITFHFDGTDFADFNALEAAFSGENPLIRLGAHIGSIGIDGEGSASYIAVPGDPGPGIPEPATAALGLIGTFLLLRRRRN